MDSVKYYYCSAIGMQPCGADSNATERFVRAEDVEALRARLVEVEAERDKALQGLESYMASVRHANEHNQNWQARAEKAEEQLTLARQENTELNRQISEYGEELGELRQNLLELAKTISPEPNEDDMTRAMKLTAARRLLEAAYNNGEIQPIRAEKGDGNG